MCTPARYLLSCNVLGVRSQSYKGMYPYPTAHTYDRQSMVDLDKPDYDDWPKFAQVKGQVCILEPGDVLYAPMVRETRPLRIKQQKATISFLFLARFDIFGSFAIEMVARRSYCVFSDMLYVPVHKGWKHTPTEQ